MSNSTRKLYIYGVAGVTVVLLVLLLFFNPEQTFLFPRCPFLMVTGYKCAGCGALRFVHSVLNGEWLAAWHYNPLLYFAFPFILFVFVISGLRYRYFWANRLYCFFSRPIFVALLTILIIGWWIGRNLI